MLTDTERMLLLEHIGDRMADLRQHQARYHSLGRAAAYSLWCDVSALIGKVSSLEHLSAWLELQHERALAQVLACEEVIQWLESQGEDTDAD